MDREEIKSPAVEPDPAPRAAYAEAHAGMHRLFAAVRPLFSDAS